MFVGNSGVYEKQFVPKFPVEPVEMQARLRNVSAAIGSSMPKKNRIKKLTVWRLRRCCSSLLRGSSLKTVWKSVRTL